MASVPGVPVFLVAIVVVVAPGGGCRPPTVIVNVGTPAPAAPAVADAPPPAAPPPVAVAAPQIDPDDPSKELVWVRSNGSLPPDAIWTGYQSGYQPSFHYLCRIPYRGGLHPGKVFGDRCNIGFGGRGIVSAPWEFEVLTNPTHLRVRWLEGPNNPALGVVGGHESYGKLLYICQARKNEEFNGGKIVNGKCNYEWANDEMVEPLQWEMLVVERAAAPPASRP